MFIPTKFKIIFLKFNAFPLKKLLFRPYSERTNTKGDDAAQFFMGKNQKSCKTAPYDVSYRLGRKRVLRLKEPPR